MLRAWSADRVRSAEHELMAGLEEGELMARAAQGLAGVCSARLHQGGGTRVVVLAGPGNNGADALYAAAHLADEGFACVAVRGDWPLAIGDADRHGIRISRRRVIPTRRALRPAPSDQRPATSHFKAAEAWARTSSRALSAPQRAVRKARVCLLVIGDPARTVRREGESVSSSTGAVCSDVFPDMGFWKYEPREQESSSDSPGQE